MLNLSLIHSRWLWFAPWAFVLIWSCGYVVAKYVVPYSPALTFLSIRYAGCVLLMGALMIWAGKSLPRGRIFWHTAAAGVLMQAGYLGGCWIGIAQGMPAGVMALIVNMQPVLTALFALWGGEHIHRRQWWGLFLGFTGVVIVLSTKLDKTNNTTFGWSAVLLAFGALFSMTAGTLYQKRFCPGVDPRSSQVVQFAASLLITLPFALTLEKQPIIWSTSFWMALLFSIFILSGLGISILLGMIERGSATQVTAYMYWVPPISSLMAWFLFNEHIAASAWPGFLLVALGVYWVVNVKVTVK